MEYSYKFRIYPTSAQIQQIQKTFGCCRFVWNHYLALRKELYEQEGRMINYNACSGDMTQLRSGRSCKSCLQAVIYEPRIPLL